MVYAALFPDRVRALVLGSYSDPNLSPGEREIEQAAEALVKDPQAASAEARSLLDRAITELSTGLDELLSGSPDVPLRLAPLLNRLRSLRDAGPIDELALFNPDLSVFPPHAPGGAPQDDAESRVLAGRCRASFVVALLAWLRDAKNTDALARMQELLEQLQHASRFGAVGQLWWVAAGLVEGLSDGSVSAGVENKRLLGRVEQHMKRIADGGEAAWIRQPDDATVTAMLFQIARAQGFGERAGPLRQAFALDALLASAAPPAPDAGELRDVGAQVRELLGQARPVLDHYFADPGASDAQELTRFITPVEQISARLGEVGQADFKGLADEIVATSQAVARGRIRDVESTSLQIASALLLLDKWARDPAGPAREWASPVHTCVTALKRLVQGELVPVEGIELNEAVLTDSELEALLHTVAGEVNENLHRVEQTIEAFALHGGDVQFLADVPAYLGQVQGAMQILGQSRAAELIHATRRQVTAIQNGDQAGEERLLDALAMAVGTIQEYMQGLQSGRRNLVAMIERAMTELQSASVAGGEGEIDAVSASENANAAFDDWRNDIADQSAFLRVKQALRDVLSVARSETYPKLARIARELMNLLNAVGDDPSFKPDNIMATLRRGFGSIAGLADRELAAAPAARPEPVPASRSAPAAPELDTDVLEIFTDEARQLLETVEGCLADWPALDSPEFADLRRAFHTLKGSGRMVGCTDVGELAWIIEDLLNRVIAGEPVDRSALQGFLATAHRELARQLDCWVHGSPEPFDADHWRARAGALPVSEEIAGSRPAPAFDEPEAPAPALAPEIAAPGTAAPVETMEFTPADAAPQRPVAPEIEAPVDARAAPDEPLEFTPPAAPQTPVAPEIEMPGETPVEEWAAPDEPMEFTPSAAPPAPIAPPGETPVEEWTVPEEPLEFTPPAAPPAPIPPHGEAPAEAWTVLDEAMEGTPPVAPQTPIPLHGEAPVEEWTVPDESMESTPPAAPQAPIPPHGEAPVETWAAPDEPLKPTPPVAPQAPIPPQIEVPAEEVAAPEMAAPVDLEPSRTARQVPIPALDEGLELDFEPAPGMELPVEMAGGAGPPELVEFEPIAAPPPGTDPPPSETVIGIFVQESSGLLAALAQASEAAPGTPASEAAQRAVHSLIGTTRALGYNTMAEVCVALQELWSVRGQILAAADLAVVRDAGTAMARFVERLVEQPGLGGTPELEAAAAGLTAHLAALPPVAAPASAGALDDSLRAYFREEAVDLLARFHGAVQQMRQGGAEAPARAELQRALHTLKGSARMVQAEAIGDLSHVVESLVEETSPVPPAELVPFLEEVHDQLLAALKAPGGQDEELMALAGRAAEMFDRGPAPAAAPPVAPEPASVPAPMPDPAPQARAGTPREATTPEGAGAPAETLRVSTEMVDHLSNYAGEVSIARARIEQQVAGFRDNLKELQVNVARFRGQLRELDIHADSQILSRPEDSTGIEDFDPLEFDRYSRLQRLSRGLAESISDLATIQTGLDGIAGDVETTLHSQARLTTELQEGLMRTRMVAFSTQVPRLRHITRQTARELDKQAELIIQGADVELDRNVLDRMLGSLEHMIRNAIDHGIETRAVRRRDGKPETGHIEIGVSQEGNEIVIRFSDDGAGVDARQISEEAFRRGLISARTELSDQELGRLIMMPGFSTAGQLTLLSGRGVGMDVVHNEVKQLGGRIVLSTEGGRTTFTVRLPLTLSIMQALIVRAGDQRYAIPVASIVNIVQLPVDELGGDEIQYANRRYRAMHLSHQLGLAPAPHEAGCCPRRIMPDLGRCVTTC